MGNAYLERQKAERDVLIQAAQEMMAQYDVDTTCRVLNRVFGFGEERLSLFMDEFSKLHEEDLKMFDPAYPEADYKREVADRELQAACGKRFVPFEKRFPIAYDIRYDKPVRRHKKR